MRYTRRFKKRYDGHMQRYWYAAQPTGRKPLNSDPKHNAVMERIDNIFGSHLTVHRKGYTRDGTRVAPATYKTKDRGAPGRTPKHKRWMIQKGRVKLGEGYTGKPAGKRHAILRREDRKKNVSSRNVWNETQGLANVQTNRKAKKVFKQDADWVMKNLMNKKEKRQMTAKARSKR